MVTMPSSVLVRQLLNAAIAIGGVIGVAGLLWAWFHGQTMVFQGSMLFVVTLCASISASVFALLAVIAPAVRRWPPVTQWVVFLPMLAIGSLLGTLLAALVLSVTGGLPATSVGTLVTENVRGTVVGTVALGTFFLAIDGYKTRLRDAEVLLQTQQIARERAERLASEAQLASLSARLQPHFLFNTLTAIAELVRDNPRLAEETIEHLSGVLRSSLDTALLVPLDREMKLVDDFLKLQRVRQGDRVRFSVDWDPNDCRGVTLPPFTVQTLVENAVKHVAGTRDTGVAISVRARRDGDQLLLEVTDDGPGFDADSLRAGHGLDTLQARLRTIYGGNARLEFDRQPAAMTVRLRLPHGSDSRMSA
jgi:LytS/YehU family sensor histidine kinase